MAKINKVDFDVKVNINIPISTTAGKAASGETVKVTNVDYWGDTDELTIDDTPVVQDGQNVYRIYEGDKPMGWTTEDGYNALVGDDKSSNTSTISKEGFEKWQKEHSFEKFMENRKHGNSNSNEATSVNSSDVSKEGFEKWQKEHSFQNYMENRKHKSGNSEISEVSSDTIPEVSIEAESTSNGSVVDNSVNDSSESIESVMEYNIENLPENSLLIENGNDNQKEFIEKIAKLARAEYVRRNLTGEQWVLPSVCIAQAILESGWNSESPTIFGVKVWKDDQESVNLSTSEYSGGGYVQINDDFVAYDSIEDAAAGYYDFILENPRYGSAVNNSDAHDTASIIAANGYATDPNYYSKISSLIDKYGLEAYDQILGVDSDLDVPTDNNSEIESTSETIKNVEEQEPTVEPSVIEHVEDSYGMANIENVPTEADAVPDNGGNNAVPYFSQGDNNVTGTRPAWADIRFGDDNIAGSGCSITSFAMIASYYGIGTENANGYVYPDDVLQKIIDIDGDRNLAYTYGLGPSQGEIFPRLADHYNLNVEQLSSQSALQSLQEGKPLIVRKIGHFFVLSGVTEDGKVVVNDPANRSKSDVAYTLDEWISREGITDFWQFTPTNQS